VGLVVGRDQEAVALGPDLGFLKAVDLGILAGPVLVDQGYLSLNPGLGLAWVLLPGAVVPGQVFLRCLGVLGFRFLLSPEDFVNSVMNSRLRYLICILTSICLGLGLEMVLVMVVGLPSLLGRQVWAWMGILMALQELWRRVLVCLLEANWLQSVVSRSRQESALGLSRNKEGYRYCRVKGGEG